MIYFTDDLEVVFPQELLKQSLPEKGSGIYLPDEDGVQVGNTVITTGDIIKVRLDLYTPDGGVSLKTDMIDQIRMASLPFSRTSETLNKLAILYRYIATPSGLELKWKKKILPDYPIAAHKCFLFNGNQLYLYYAISDEGEGIINANKRFLTKINYDSGEEEWIYEFPIEQAENLYLSDCFLDSLTNKLIVTGNLVPIMKKIQKQSSAHIFIGIIDNRGEGKIIKKALPTIEIPAKYSTHSFFSIWVPQYTKMESEGRYRIIGELVQIMDEDITRQCVDVGALVLNGFLDSDEFSLKLFSYSIPALLSTSHRYSNYYSYNYLGSISLDHPSQYRFYTTADGVVHGLYLIGSRETVIGPYTPSLYHLTIDGDQISFKKMETIESMPRISASAGSYPTDFITGAKNTMEITCVDESGVLVAFYDSGGSNKVKLIHYNIN